MASALLLAATLLAFSSQFASAQWTPLRFGNSQTLSDEFGQKLKGNSTAASQFGHAHVEGDLVQVLTADSGVFPPNSDGTPHFANTVLFTTRIGQGMSAKESDPAKFAASVSPRPNGQSVFVRVFNAPTIAEASFYTDSSLHNVSSSADAMLVIDNTQTDEPLDAADDDGDGLHNSWEKSYGTDSDDADSDDDGLSDYEEHLAGTNPMDAASKFTVARLVASGGQLVLEWDSIPGKNYIVEYSNGSLSGDPIYSALSGLVSATDSVTQHPITSGLEQVQASYRVRVVVE